MPRGRPKSKRRRTGRVEERLLDLLLPLTSGAKQGEAEVTEEPEEPGETHVFVAGPGGVRQTPLEAGEGDGLTPDRPEVPDP